MFCPNCGASVSAGAHFCEACGHAVHEGAAASAPTHLEQPDGAGASGATRGFDQDDALAAAGMAAPLVGRGGGGDIAGYMMSKAALENLEERGEGDSAMADMARTGLAVSKVKLTLSIIGFVIFLIVALIMWSNFKSQENQFNQGGLGPSPSTCVVLHAGTGACGVPR